jgi:hypothetical protein
LENWTVYHVGVILQIRLVLFFFWILANVSIFSKRLGSSRKKEVLIKTSQKSFLCITIQKYIKVKNVAIFFFEKDLINIYLINNAHKDSHIRGKFLSSAMVIFHILMIANTDSWQMAKVLGL